jgi:(p)ppGpp synthase/HD superfamily hydrolase
MTPWNAETYAKAWAYASRCHYGQTYGGTVEGEKIEYINHIASVAMEIMAVLQQESGLDGNLAIQCALLHDTLEDTSATYAEIKTEFGIAVADGVLALTKDAKIADKADKMADSLRRIKLQPREIWMVKMADRVTNLYHPPFYWDNRKILSYRDEAALIHSELHEASPVLAKRLQSMIDRYPQFLRTE